MNKYFDILRRCRLFDSVADSDLLAMLGCFSATVEFFDKKYTIMAEGHTAKFIGIMLSGTAQIVQVDYYGNRSIVSNISPAELFCEAFACAEIASLPVSVIANEPCEVLLIDSRHILHTCSKNCRFHQQIIYNLMKSLAEKNIIFHQRSEILSKRSTREKLLAYLNLYSRKSGSLSFDIPFDRQELADYLEVDRSGLSAEISKLRKEGIIESHRRHFELL